MLLLMSVNKLKGRTRSDLIVTYSLQVSYIALLEMINSSNELLFLYFVGSKLQ